ncbi:hypothetical protein [Oceanobacillus alkalisoli]|uniref:hypothetical protein n=1 Tax=Oceanobacillus alkalisoli TaxID=2925113 RepID=UPI001EF127B0|nr:hypothetical protein [Oceanobacillus alkalisoli]MCF3944975.1 hypothetical protein [Oceanobacillus alkalisoli]MCG5103665.1 hypothetical protein [Oceanobacillus alkalisoli]
MSRINFQSFTGYVTSIEDFPMYPPNDNFGCYKFISVQNDAGAVVNFVAGPDTFFLYQEKIQVGDQITGYYDGDAPAILIYPPQYRALVIVKENPYSHVKVSYFNDQLISSDGTLQLNIGRDTQIQLTNGQDFKQSPAGRNLIVVYGATTKSIPAQTTPYEIIIFCR